LAADAYTPPESVPSLDLIDDEVRSGLPSSATRRDGARTAEEVYQYRSLQYLEKREAESDDRFRARPKRTTTVLRGVTDKLAEPVYDPGPTRAWPDDLVVQEWLSRAYAACAVDALLLEAEAAATLNHVAAVQVEATGDARRPIRLWLWKGHQLEVITRDDDPVNPWAVVTIDAVASGPRKIRTRYRAWSAGELREYRTEPFDDATTAGGRRADWLAQAGPTPYPGVLPFVFLRAKPAPSVSTFWEGGIGQPLVALNLDLDRCESNLAEHVEAFLNPIAYARNIQDSQRLFIRPGDFVVLKGTAAQRTGDARSEPDLAYLQAELGVEPARLDMKARCDATLEELGLPLTTIRSDSSTDLSGVAIVAKAVPLTRRTRKRQRQLTEFEQELAAKILAVAAAWYGPQGWPDATRAMAAAREPALVVTWPEPQIPLPTPERDAADAWELEQGLTDPIEVLARRRGITLEQAEALAAQIADRRQRWATLMGEPDTPAPPAPPKPDNPASDDDPVDPADDPAEDPEPAPEPESDD
jgi:hypothetical protein